MHLEENVPVRPGKLKVLSVILIGIFTFAVGGVGGYWVGSRQQQSSATTHQPSPKPSGLPSALPVQRLSPAPTIATSQTDPTTNWKIYRNTKIGFEMKYPPGYQVPYTPIKGGLGASKEVNGSEDNTHITFDELSMFDSSVKRILLIVFPYTRTLDELVKNPTAGPYFDYDHPTVKLKDLTVDGKPAFWFVTTEDGKQSDMEIFFVGKDHGFILQIGLTHNPQEIEQILSTFRFIH